MLVDGTIRSTGKVRAAYIAILAIWLASVIANQPPVMLSVRIFVGAGAAVGVVRALLPRTRIRWLALITILSIPLGAMIAVYTIWFHGYDQLVPLEYIGLVAITVVGCLLLAWFDGPRRDDGNLPTARVR